MSDLVKRRHLSLLICVSVDVNISPFMLEHRLRQGSDNAHGTSWRDGSLPTSAGDFAWAWQRQKTHSKNNYSARL